MDVSEPSAKSAASAAKRGSTNLILLGSAAVLAIYGAGYLRTRSAAQRFTAAERRPAAAVQRATVDSLSAKRDMPILAAIADTLTKAIAPPAIAAKASPPIPDTRSSKPDTQSAITAAAKSVDSTPPPAVPTIIATPPATAAITAPPAVDSAPHPADTVRARFKDGSYSGWGTSRHGDIQATVEIKDGVILSATITQCLTRYSCSRIARIIPQVVARQSAEVDYVSGATQSSDAFYYAVLEALTKAK